MTSTLASPFDAAAQEYAEQLGRGLVWSGENSDYFVRGRIARLQSWLELHRIAPSSILDFGCGVGNAIDTLHRVFRPSQLYGLDPSRQSLETAKQRHASIPVTWSPDGEMLRDDSLDLIYTSGVFHHIPPEQRPREWSRMLRWLRPGGVLAFFENNPWNPGTRFVMSRIPFDRDAECLSPWESVRSLREAGFEVDATYYLFIFPSCLASLRFLEPKLENIPFGAQYLVLARRPKE